jgi:hypothetical protein
MPRSHTPSSISQARPTVRPKALVLCLQLLLAGAAVLALGTARADALDDTHNEALGGQLADVGSTGMGLLLGAAEANPLGILTLGAKAVAYQHIKQAPAVEQPRLWGLYGAAGWGAAANNLCIIGAIATGGAAAALCPVLGIAAGMGMWNKGSAERDRATFDAMCQEARRSNPDLHCIYTPNT